MENLKQYDLALLMFNIIRSNTLSFRLKNLHDKDGNSFDFSWERGEVEWIPQYSSAQHEHVAYEERIIKSTLLPRPVIYYMKNDEQYSGFADNIEDLLPLLIDLLIQVWDNIKEAVKARNGCYRYYYYETNNEYHRLKRHHEKDQIGTLEYEQMDLVFSTFGKGR
jgi:hypothetical protein